MRSRHLGDRRFSGSCCWRNRALYALVVIDAQRPASPPLVLLHLTNRSGYEKKNIIRPHG